MARTLSQDVRDRFFATIDGGLIRRAAADRFVVSASTAIRSMHVAVQHGRAIAKPRGGDWHSGRIEAHCSLIRGLFAERGEITVVQIQARLAERGVSVGIGTLHRSFVRHVITRRKTGMRSSETARTA